jgi:hypothetical protein
LKGDLQYLERDLQYLEEGTLSTLKRGPSVPGKGNFSTLKGDTFSTLKGDLQYLERGHLQYLERGPSVP